MVPVPAPLRLHRRAGTELDQPARAPALAVDEQHVRLQGPDRQGPAGQAAGPGPPGRGSDARARHHARLPRLRGNRARGLRPARAAGAAGPAGRLGGVRASRLAGPHQRSLGHRGAYLVRRADRAFRADLPLRHGPLSRGRQERRCPRTDRLPAGARGARVGAPGCHLDAPGVDGYPQGRLQRGPRHLQGPRTGPELRR